MPISATGNERGFTLIEAIMVITITGDYASRTQSYRLLAKALGLSA